MNGATKKYMRNEEQIHSLLWGILIFTPVIPLVLLTPVVQPATTEAALGTWPSHPLLGQAGAWTPKPPTTAQVGRAG
jgi:hypothetical protein